MLVVLGCAKLGGWLPWRLECFCLVARVFWPKSKLFSCVPNDVLNRVVYEFIWWLFHAVSESDSLTYKVWKLVFATE